MNILILIGGLILLVKGADFFVDGASSFAGILRVPAIIVGLTIVAFGTSMPEAAVSSVAALSGSNDIALSNVVGSNIFNFLVVLGMSSFFMNLPVAKSIIKQDLPFLIVISLGIVALSYTGYQLGRVEGIFLLGVIILYVGYLVYKAIQSKASQEIEEVKHTMPKALLIMALGIAGIIVGGEFVVRGAKEIALSFGLSEKLVGLTIVSIGTSLPELITSLVAAKKGKADIAIGNVVGSNIFNLLFILGLSSTISPIQVNPVIVIDMGVMIFATGMTYLIVRKQEKITKYWGAFFLISFILYTIYIIIRN